MPRVFDFQEQLSLGKQGEHLFAECYSNRNVVLTDGVKFDFLIDDGKTVELKTDSYSVADTRNFFMERATISRTTKSGGPWRAFEDNVDYFVYLFLKNRIFYWFEPASLIERLDDITRDMEEREIDNSTYVGVGYTVPRQLLAGVCVDIKKF